MLSDRVVRISDIPNADQREYLKNMLTDIVVRISDTSIAGQRKYLIICKLIGLSEFLTTVLLASWSIKKSI
jgi:hypothetical protein